MKITLNLSPAASLRDRFALAWAIPATVLGLAAAILLGRASLHEYRDFKVIQQQLAEVEKRTQELSSQESSLRKKLEDPADHELRTEVKFVNQIIDQRQLSLSSLTARVAGLMPEDAHLTGFALTAPKKPGDDYMLRMGIMAKGEDAIETFLNDLEDAPDFKDVAIVNQGFQEEAVQGEQVNVICTARYLPGVDVSSEEADGADTTAKSEASPKADKPDGAKTAEKTGKSETSGKSGKTEKKSEKEPPPDHKPSR